VNEGLQVELVPLQQRANDHAAAQRIKVLIMTSPYGGTPTGMKLASSASGACR
jgi:hypothetical protein